MSESDARNSLGSWQHPSTVPHPSPRSFHFSHYIDRKVDREQMGTLRLCWRIPIMRHQNPWKWPACVGLALTLVILAVWFIPRSWFFLLSQEKFSDQVSLGAVGNQWLVLAPPPEIVVETQAQPPRPNRPSDPNPGAPYQDPLWWREGILVRIAADGPGDRRMDRGAVAPDSVKVALEMLGVGGDILKRSKPDSLLAARLFALKVSDGFSYDEAKPFLKAMTRSRAYADIMSRASDMFNDFLSHQIMVPDEPDPEQHRP